MYYSGVINWSWTSSLSILVSLCAAEYSKEKVLLNECCEPNTEMRMESSLFWIADTELQVIADAIHLDA